MSKSFKRDHYLGETRNIKKERRLANRRLRRKFKERKREGVI